MRKNKPEKTYIYVATTLVDTEGDVLVQHRDNNPRISAPNQWGMCGGRKEETDDTDEAAASRELLEETGYVVAPGDLVQIGDDSFYVGETLIVRKFYAARYDGRQQIQTLEGQEISFKKVSELTGLDFCDYSHMEYLRDASRVILQSNSVEQGLGTRGERI